MSIEQDLTTVKSSLKIFQKTQNMHERPSQEKMENIYTINVWV